MLNWIPKLSRMGKKFHLTLYWVCDYLFVLGFKLNHVRKRDHNDSGRGLSHRLSSCSALFLSPCPPFPLLTEPSTRFSQYFLLSPIYDADLYEVNPGTRSHALELLHILRESSLGHSPQTLDETLTFCRAVVVFKLFQPGVMFIVAMD